MPLTFRRSFRILPGVRLNINRRSWSVTGGGRRGPRRTFGSAGRRTTSVDLPGPFGFRRTSAVRGSRRHSSSRTGSGAGRRAGRGLTGGLVSRRGRRSRGR